MKKISQLFRKREEEGVKVERIGNIIFIDTPGMDRDYRRAERKRKLINLSIFVLKYIATPLSVTVVGAILVDHILKSR